MTETVKNHISKLLCAVLTMIIIVGAAVCMTAQAASQSDYYANAVLFWTNVERSRAGLGELKTTDTLMSASNVRANELIKLYSHDRPGGKNTFTIFDEYAGYKSALRSGGENIARGFDTPYDVVRGWMGSASHRATLLSGKYNYMGAGYAYSASADYMYYWEELFMGTPETLSGTRESFYVAPTAISLDTASLTLSVGGKSTVSAGIQPAYATAEVKCLSSNPAVVKVSGTTVTSFDIVGVGNGTATLTFTCGDVKKSINVTVGTGDDRCVDDLGHNYVNGVCTRCGKPIPNPFTDIGTCSESFRKAIIWANNKGIAAGATATTYNPNGSCTRGQVVSFLWRAAGKPDPMTSDNPYTDVQSTAYYYKAILWTAEHGITAGYDDGTFRPGATVTRGQFVTFLWRYKDKPMPVSAVNPFTDVKSGGFYNAILWGSENGIVAGYQMNDGTMQFKPNNPCTRAHVAVFLYRAMGD